MNDLLFTALIIALLYYFFYHLPLEKQLPLKHTQQTQTETLPNPDDQALESTLDELIKNIRHLNQTLK